MVKIIITQRYFFFVPSVPYTHMFFYLNFSFESFFMAAFYYLYYSPIQSSLLFAPLFLLYMNVEVLTVSPPCLFFSSAKGRKD